MKSVLLALLTALLPPGAAALSWKHKGYCGLFNDRGIMVPRWEWKYYDHGDLCSQLDTPITMPWSEYAETKYGRQPKWLYHCTHRTAAEQIAKDRAIYESDDSKPGDAFLGDGVYMTAMPVDWADPEAVKRNNWGPNNARKFENWHKLNAYVRVRFDKLWDAKKWAKIEYKENWQSNFCVKTRAGVLYLTKELDAEIWFHSSYEGRGNGELPELYWSAKGGYTPFSRMTRKKHTVRPGNEEMTYICGRGWVVDRAPKKTKYTRDTGPRVEVGNGYIRTTSIPDWAGPPGGW